MPCGRRRRRRMAVRIMLARLILLLTIVPLVELVILLRLAQAISWGPTIFLVVVTGVLGAWLARREGLRTLHRVQEDMAAGRPPTLTLMEGVMVLVAGVVLVTPGILTDLAGFALLVPSIRRWVAQRMAKSLKRRIVMAHPGGVDPFIDVPASGRDAGENEDVTAVVRGELTDTKGTE